MRAGLVQISSTDEPAQNLVTVEALIREAAAQDAGFVLTPETTNIISADRAHKDRVLVHEGDDQTLARLRIVAAELGIWLLIGSLALKTDEARLANRSFLIAPDGTIHARYDKIHMFDVTLGDGEVYRESSAFRPGDRAVVTGTPFAGIGLSICYDLRFPHLYRGLARAGAQILTIPAAFTVPTGRAHWEVLLRARAIETGCFVLAPAQCGTHAAMGGKPRLTYGHSLAIDPWGAVLGDGGTLPGVTLVDLDLDAVARARASIPALTSDPDYAEPQPDVGPETE